MNETYLTALKAFRPQFGNTQHLTVKRKADAICHLQHKLDCPRLRSYMRQCDYDRLAAMQREVIELIDHEDNHHSR